MQHKQNNLNLENNQLFFYTKFPEKKIKVGKILKIMEKLLF